MPIELSFRESCCHVRDVLLPEEFHGVRMVATATSSTKLKSGLYARLYFLLSQPLPNKALEQYAVELNASHSGLCLDGGVFQTGKPIYTARPIFKRMRDPLPQDEWVVILDGDKELVELNLDQLPAQKRSGTAYTPETNWLNGQQIRWFGEDVSPPTAADTDDPFLAEVIANEGAGINLDFTEFGVKVLEEAFSRIIEAQPSQRHFTINRESFSVGQRVTEGHIPLWFNTGNHVGDVLMAAAARMKFNDKYSTAELHQKISEGLSAGAARPRLNWDRDDE
jgi:hypothetical protein